MTRPHLSKIILYPIKALDPFETGEAEILKSGALRHDRAFAIVDTEGHFVNGKRNTNVHRLRSEFDLTSGNVTLRDGASTQFFQMAGDRSALEGWLSKFFGFPAKVRHDSETGFPDDTQASGPTIISTSTLETVASWYPELNLESVRRRFRANLEIGGVPPFWEDRLYGAKGEIVHFRIGSVAFEGINPCQRCAVPKRDPLTGEPIKDFQKTFMLRRQETLPAWADASRFDHFYRLAVNTRIPSSESGKSIKVGDLVEL